MKEKIKVGLNGLGRIGRHIFKMCMEDSLIELVGINELNPDINNWVYDFGKFKFLENWLREHFDHTLLVAKDDPEIDLIRTLNSKAAKIIELDKISCEHFAEITFRYIEESLADLDVKVVSVEVSEHESNSAGFYRN